MPLDPARLLGRRHGPVPIRWSADDTLRYAEAVGCTDGIRAAPNAPPAFAATLTRHARPPFAPLGVDPRRVLHLSQSIDLPAPLPVAAAALGTSEVAAVSDAGRRGAVLEIRSELHDARAGHLLAAGIARYLARGAGGFDAGPVARPAAVVLPSGEADLELQIHTTPDQAVRYARLGDDNPIHLDAAAAREAGFERPILHGLCSFGLVGCVLVTRGAMPGLSGLELDFRAPVFPGELLKLEAWRQGDGALLRLTAPSRDGAILSLGRCFARGAARSSGRG